MGFLFSRIKKNSKKTKDNVDSINIDSEEEDEIIKEESSKRKKMKIHICGLWKKYQEIIDMIFNKNVIIENNEDKNNIKFNYIIQNYEDEILTDEILLKIEDQIDKDKTDQKDAIESHAMLCFGDENNIDKVFDEFCLINTPRIIFVTENKKELKKNGKKYVINIISKEMNDNELKNNIELSLKKIYFYYNEIQMEKDNKDFPLNLLLCGMRLSGKSTFINLFSGKLTALVGNDTEFGTLKTTEYGFYKDENKESPIIKLIDTPGITDEDKVNKQTLRNIQKYMLNPKINFILFFYNEQSFLGESGKLLDLLNKSKIPVLFIINKSIYNKDKKCEDIKTKMKYLKKNKYIQLAKENNFIQVNIITSEIKFYGIDSIFNKIEEYTKNNKVKDTKIFDTINYYKNKKDWEKDEPEIIQKSQDSKNLNLE